MRYVFTDKWNSFWHAAFGALSLRYPFIIPIFILYQIIQGTLNDLVIDTGEFFIGLLVVYGLSKIKMFYQNFNFRNNTRTQLPDVINRQ